MRQKAVAVPDSSATAAVREEVDFMFEDGRFSVCYGWMDSRV
jgi:hypothetical protein